MVERLVGQKSEILQKNTIRKKERYNLANYVRQAYSIRKDENSVINVRVDFWLELRVCNSRYALFVIKIRRKIRYIVHRDVIKLVIISSKV